MADRDKLYQRAVKAKEELISMQEYEAASVIRDLLTLCQCLEDLEAKQARKARRKVPTYSK